MKTILKIFGGLFLGICLFIGVRFYQFHTFLQTNVGKCVNLYISTGVLELEKDPEIQKKIREEGHKDLYALILHRCKQYNANGQKF